MSSGKQIPAANGGKSTTFSLNDTFREEFLNDLPARIEELNACIGKIQDSDRPDSVLGELFRLVHAIRGSSSTFGLQILASICNPLEEQIQLASEQPRVPQKTIFLMREYVALLAQETTSLASGKEDFDKAEIQLIRLQQKTFSKKFSIAVAVNSRVTLSLCKEIGRMQGARIVAFDDSMNALQRVLVEPFDAIVVSSELYPMRGEALITALNMSPRHEFGFKTVLISSDMQKKQYCNRQFDPDFVVVRDQSFVEKLEAALVEIHKQRQTYAEAQ